MRIRRDIAYLLLGVRRPMIRRGSLQTQLLAHEAVDLTAVGAALRLAHDEADDRADRLGLAALELLDGLRVGLERTVDDALELVAARHPPPPPPPPPAIPSERSSTICSGSPPSAASTSRTVLPTECEIVFAET